jgi:hypothetical protein
MIKEYVDKNTGIITYQLPQPCEAKYLVVLVDKGKTIEVNYFDTLKEAKRTFREIANDFGYEPKEINESGSQDVSIWKWTKYRYKKI